MIDQYSSYPFLKMLEDNWEDILSELDNVLYNEVVSEKGYFHPWHEHHLYDGNWDVYGLYAFGEKIHSNCNQCPKTTSLIESIPGLVTAGFSAMDPGTYIRPHVGYTGEVLRCHLGLIIPKESTCINKNANKIPIFNCALKVENIFYTWTAGKAFVFDDTKEHSAWNYGDRTRFILLLDFKKYDDTLNLPHFTDRLTLPLTPHHAES